MNSKIITFLVIICAFQAKAQDPIFTQYYLVPETLNPAFTGIANTWNAGLVHRRQWPDGNRKMDTQFAYLSTIVSDEIGVGMNFMNQKEVFTNLNYFKVNAAISYRVNLNYDWRLRLGLEGGLGRKDFNFGNLLLEDQININTGQVNPISIDPEAGNQNNQINFFDLAAGFEIDQEHAWFGVAVKHLTRPNIAFRENANLPLDLFISVHGGYYLDLSNGPANFLPDETTLLLTGNYMRQGQYNRLDLGTIMDFNRFSIGVIATTNPEAKSSNSHLLTSINPVMSVKFSEFTFGYSYDWNISNLGRTQGIHEITLIWQSSRRCDRCEDYSLKLKRNGESGYDKL